MELKEQYRQQVLSLVAQLKRRKKPAVIFGAGRAGWYLLKVLEYYDVPVVAFADNDPGKKTYCGRQVRLPKELAAEHPDCCVLLGVFVPGTAASIQQQLYRHGFQHVADHCIAPFLYEYMVTVAGRVCDHTVLARSIGVLMENYQEGPTHYGYTKHHRFVSPFVTSVITQRCTLRCRDCAQLIPYYRDPVHFSARTVVRDLKQYAGAFDVVPEISMHGGEPFTHPEIQEICREAAAISNIVFINFTTNGTVLPSDETLRVLAMSGADIHQSDYGALSKLQDSLFIACRNHNVYCDIHYTSETEQWARMDVHRHFRDSSSNDELYRTCMTSKICCQLMDGELHRCALSMHATAQGQIPKVGQDYVRLCEADDTAVAGKIREFLTRPNALTVCDYCGTSESVSPAVQL